MKKIILVDDPTTKTDLLPLTYTRPVADLRVGITTIREKWERVTGAECFYLTDDYLCDKFNCAPEGTESFFIAGNLLPTSRLLDAMEKLNPGEELVKDGKRLCYRGFVKHRGEEYNASSSVDFDDEVIAVNYLYDIFLLNDMALKEDFAKITADRESAPLSDSNIVIGDRSLIFLEEGARVEGSFINTTGGPVYVGRDAEIMEGSCLRGSIAVCEHSVVNMGTKIYGATTVGPWCKVGGELNNVVMIGYSNKAHDGFLGNAVVGEWCNIGAGCVASNLKNDYTEIKLWNYNAHRFTRTGLQFCGLMMGDHSKAGINTMFNTATVLGVGVNVYGSGFQRNFLASFSEGSRAGFTDVPLSKFFEVARRVMARRGCELTDVDCRIFEHINEMAHNFKY
ncbi:MAG: glucose-1-phosphate thymidylyltransferase [Muribaculaceae bacterium]|nr:glucose-1-phosphate thymidylyltransferase [Muribaculaceae bacterium]